MKHAFALPLLTLALAGCATVPSPSPEKVAGLNDDARKTAAGLIQALGGELKAAMTTGGPAGAIGVCKEKAPQIAAEAAQKTGMKIKRVSSKNRNPKGVPDAWETQALAELEKRLAAGEKPETLDLHAVVVDGEAKEFRYAKALITQPLCLVCHGDPDKMAPDVNARLAAEYPTDKAVGYSTGMLRGILSIRKPL